MEEVRDALGLAPDVPMLECDARLRDSVKVLLALTEVVLTRRLSRMSSPAFY